MGSLCFIKWPFPYPFPPCLFQGGCKMWRAGPIAMQEVLHEEWSPGIPESPPSCFTTKMTPCLFSQRCKDSKAHHFWYLCWISRVYCFGDLDTYHFIRKKKSTQNSWWTFLCFSILFREIILHPIFGTFLETWKMIVSFWDNFRELARHLANVVSGNSCVKNSWFSLTSPEMGFNCSRDGIQINLKSRYHHEIIEGSCHASVFVLFSNLSISIFLKCSFFRTKKTPLCRGETWSWANSCDFCVFFLLRPFNLCWKKLRSF